MLRISRIVAALLVSASVLLTSLAADEATTQRITELSARIALIDKATADRQDQIIEARRTQRAIQLRLQDVRSSRDQLDTQRASLEQQSAATEKELATVLEHLRYQLRWVAMLGGRAGAVVPIASESGSGSRLGSRFLLSKVLALERSNMRRVEELRDRLAENTQKLAHIDAQLAESETMIGTFQAQFGQLTLSLEADLNKLAVDRTELQRQIDLLKERLEQRMAVEPGDQALTMQSQTQGSGFIVPIKARMIERFGATGSKRRTGFLSEKGLEFEAPAEQAVQAAASGTVVELARVPGSGWVVIIEHAAGLFSLYAGLKTVVVSRAQPIEQGASLGTSFASDEGSFYFEVRQGGKALDPRKLFNR